MKYDEIHIENLEFYARHGVFPEETKLGQKFIISLVMYTNTRGAGEKDDLELSVDYGAVSHFITEYMQKNTFKLIEAAAENLARELLLRYPLLEGVDLELKKPWAPVGLPLEYVSVKISRCWHKAYLGLGSNMGDKKGYLDYAVKRLNEENGCKVEKVSDYLVTEPYGGVEQDDFLNACLLLNPSPACGRKSDCKSSMLPHIGQEPARPRLRERHPRPPLPQRRKAAGPSPRSWAAL